MIKQTFYFFLLLCEFAAIILLIMGLVQKVRRLIERN